MSIARIFAFSLALTFVTAIGATAFTPGAYAADPVNGGKIKVSSTNGGTKPAEPCCSRRGR